MTAQRTNGPPEQAVHRGGVVHRQHVGAFPTKSSPTADRDIDSVVGLQFSFSYSSPGQFGNEKARAAFETDLRSALVDRFGVDAVLTERLTTELITATRPNGGS